MIFIYVSGFTEQDFIKMVLKYLVPTGL